MPMDPKPIPKMDAKEFRERGYLQEVNRQFFHPLGLALEVIVDRDESGEITQTRFGGVWDYRDDPEGMRFAEFSPEEVERGERVMDEQRTKISSRVAALGYVVQPLEGTS